MGLRARPRYGQVIRSEIARRLRRRHSDDWPASELLGAAETFDVRPAIYDPEHLQRVVKTGFDRTMESEVEKLDARVVRSTPPKLTVFEDVLSCGGRFFGPGTNHFMAKGQPIRQAFQVPSEYDHVVITNSSLGLRYFGHWLRDDCAARGLARPSTAILKSLVRPDWSDCRFYEEAFDQDWPEEAVFFARKLTVLTDIGFSPDKRRRLNILRGQLRQKSQAGDNRDGIVYIRRGETSVPRTMANEDALVARLSDAGITIVEAETGGETIARAMLDAAIVIGIEGSQLTHATYNLRDNGALLVIQPPDRFYNPHHEWARLLGMRYGVVVGHARTSGYVVDADDIFVMMDRLMAALDTRSEI